MAFEMILECKGKQWDIRRKFDLLVVPQLGWKISLSYHGQEFVVKEVIYDLYQEDIWVWCEPLELEQFIFIAWDDREYGMWQFASGGDGGKKEFYQLIQEYDKKAVVEAN